MRILIFIFLHKSPKRSGRRSFRVLHGEPVGHAMVDDASAAVVAATPSDGAKDTAALRLQRFVRRRRLHFMWLETVADLLEWNQLVNQLAEQREKREKAAAVMQRGVRRSPATNVAMRVASRRTFRRRRGGQLSIARVVVKTIHELMISSS